MADNASVFKPENLTKGLVLKLIFCAFLALFWVIFLWNFWARGIYALGLNASVFLLLFFALFIWVLYRQEHYAKADLVWIIPIGLIVLSYALYDNPFLKMISLLVWPATFIIFYNQAYLPDKQTKNWDW